MANESEVAAVSTSSKVSDASPSLTIRQRWRNVPLHERCSLADMLVIKKAFQDAFLHKLLPNQFRELLRTQFNLEYDDDEFKILFLKINTNRNGEMEWDELVSHLLLGYFTNDPENQRASLQLAIMGRPTIMRSMHRHPISKICFCPDVAKDRSTTPMQGSYITASRDGQLNWWTLDMTMLRTAYSSSPVLKVRTTWVTDCVCLPDVNMLVTSSTERDLRFYDITAKTFTLKIVITSWEFMICTMYYYFHKDINEKCILILGDAGGNVRVLQFSPIERGPFRNEAGKPLQTLRHIDLQRKKDALAEMHLIERPRVHTDWVRQVSWYAPLHCLVSCATCPDALLMCDLQGSKTHNVFRVEKGIHCFAFDEEAHVLVTGGPDCTVRVWSPFVPATPNLVLQGHHAGIIAVVLQNNGQLIYSLARDRVIKVWDVQGQNCVQTFIDVPPQIGERTPISAVYNPATRELILAAIKIAVLVLDEQLNTSHTDGFTHSRAIARVLYNPLFKVVITCGLDSIIINWNPLTGKRNVMMRDAHTRQLHGERIPVEITAACFDPGYQLLCTGARDGSVKTWNFNSGLNLRTLTIEYMMEVTGVFWVEGRIMAVGWNRHVTEFEDTGTATTGKSWETRHSEDILAAAARMPLSLATSSYNSEMILWKLETGQPYRMFSCTEPMLRIKMQFNKRDMSRGASSGASTKRHSSSAHRPNSTSGRGVDTAAAVQKARARRVSAVALPARAHAMRQLAVHAMVFLETRRMHMHVASLMVSLENGMVQAWSDHSAGGFQGSFQAVHTAGDYVSALATDAQNNYLFTGTTVGYIKTWLLTNYLTNDKVHVSMPALRLQFPFLWRDRIEGRAKRCVRDQPLPLLLNSYRGHVRCVTTLAYIDEYKLLLSGSSDYSVRVWRLSGEYLQTLGSFQPWNLDVTAVPPDVKKVASFTTMKVFRSGYVSRYVPGQIEIDKLRDITERELRTGTFGAPCDEPLLGHHFKLPRRPETQDRIVLDDSLQTIPLYAHLRMASTMPVRRPRTPELVRATRLRRAAAAGKKAHFGSTSNMENANQRPSADKRDTSGGEKS